jgi:lipopolysaccharide assembly outer membrane protein LptD (OstA)|tara:strand:- start:2179 stop:4737 length:2559 start_codon:yes stop_codon:yes gene_type:complete
LFNLKINYSQDIKEKDSIVSIDSITKQPLLLGKITRNAKGYIKIDKTEGKLYLYDNAELYYQDTELKAGIIILDYNKNEVAAGRIKDSSGKLIQPPFFKQAGNEVNPDSIRFNFNTKKAIIWNSKSEQNGMNVSALATKKENDSVYFIKEAKVTTSKNIEDPDYYIRIRKGKFIPKSKIIAGLSNLYIANVPTPIFLPFAYFPLTENRRTGFIFPSIGQNNDRGYFIQNGGYYFAPSDFFDVALLGDYYTNGSYGFRTEIKYKKRYSFNGSLSARFENLINGERGLPGYSKNNIYNIRWSHSQDSKSNPNSRFSASVNLGSSNYFRESVNQLNTPNFLNNTLNSSISYSKTFRSYPSVNVSLTASHSQNTRTQTVNMSLPTLTANMERIYPFVKKNGQKKGFFKNINLQYTVRGENRIKTSDSLFLKKEMFNDASYGMKHSIPISTNFKVLKHLSVSVSGSFEEVWTGQTIKKNDFDITTQSLGKKDTIKGFDRFSKYNFNASIGTTIYGVFNFKEGKKIQSIRHVMRPSVTYGINPSFEKYYDQYIIDANGNTSEYTRFEGGFFGIPGNNFSSAVGLGLSNILEAKVKDRDSTIIEPNKIKLLNNLNLSTSYNIAADSLNWSPIRMTTGTSLFDNKLNINLGATFDPYAINENGSRINKFNINNKGGLFRMTSANINMGFSFSSKNSKDDKSESSGLNNTRSGGRDDDLFGRVDDFADSSFDEEEDEEEDSKKEDSKFYNNKMPWDIRLAHSLTYSNNKAQKQITNNSLMFSGNISLSKKWKIGGSSGYDFKNSGVTYTQLRFERDLDSWKMNFNWVPFSTRASWYFFIGIKSSLLSDLKYDKRRLPDKRL